MPCQLTRAALHAAAPDADPGVWVPVLQAAFDRYGFDSQLRQAAALGQFSGEAGPAFKELSEDLYYVHATRICEVWPSLFPQLGLAELYVRDPEKLANRVYAHKLGNGDVASGDGYRFRGGGLIQLTGRENYTRYAEAKGFASPGLAADYVRTPEGAADSACWFLAAHNIPVLADRWRLTEMTRRINGPALLANRVRIAAANAALEAFHA